MIFYIYIIDKNQFSHIGMDILKSYINNIVGDNLNNKKTVKQSLFVFYKSNKLKNTLINL